MENWINEEKFLENYNLIIEKYNQIRALPHAECTGDDFIGINVDGYQVNFLSEQYYSRGGHETYEFSIPLHVLNQPNEWFAKEYLDKYETEQAKILHDKEVLEQQQIQHRKNQYEQLKKEFENN